MIKFKRLKYKMLIKLMIWISFKIVKKFNLNWNKKLNNKIKLQKKSKLIIGGFL